MYGMGVAIADYDNDGRDDVYITALEGDRLFHNEGGGKFRDVTEAAGIDNANFGTSAAWLDYDATARLDLFVANYVQWTPAERSVVLARRRNEILLHAGILQGRRSKLYHNLGGGKFEDVSQKAGIADPDQQVAGRRRVRLQRRRLAGHLRRQRHAAEQALPQSPNGTFSEEAVGAGVAFGEDGVARGAMGVDAADYDRSGRPHLLVGNFSNQMLGLYHNEGNGLFVDEAPRSTVGRASLLSLAFGRSSSTTIWMAIPTSSPPTATSKKRSAACSPKSLTAQPPLLFRNLGKGKFGDRQAGGAEFARPIVARGAAYGDFDRDGDLDVLISTNHGLPHLFRNDGGNANNG